MGVILDTSVLVAAERRMFRLEELLRSLGDEPVAMAAISAAELLHGCHRARDPGIQARRSAFVEGLLNAVTIFPFGIAEARRHAQLWADLVHEGPLIGPYDMLVGATAVARAFGLATLNQRGFTRIRGLKLVSVERFTS